MNTWLYFSIKMTFILLVINSGFLAAQAQGVYNLPVGDADYDTLVGTANTNLGLQPGLIVQTSLPGALDAFVKLITDGLGNLANLIWGFLFGYVNILTAIFPGELSWVAGIFATPFIFMQAMTFGWFIMEAKNLLIKVI